MKHNKLQHNQHSAIFCVITIQQFSCDAMQQQAAVNRIILHVCGLVWRACFRFVLSSFGEKLCGFPSIVLVLVLPTSFDLVALAPRARHCASSHFVASCPASLRHISIIAPPK